MFFKVCLFLASAICLLGFCYKVSRWFRYEIGQGQKIFSTKVRVRAALKGICSTVFSPRILILLKVFVLDVLLQLRVLRQDRLRWIMHMLIFYGFSLLLLFHALERFIPAKLFADYASTLNPFLFLRNIFFLMVIIGLAVAVYRRFILKVPRLMTNLMDHYTIILLAVIMLSGVFLEASKIGAYSEFQRMVKDYSDTDDKEEIKALETFWVKYYGTVSSNVKAPFDEDILSQGKDLHETSCAACHSRPQWAPLSYATALVMRPVAEGLDRMGMPGFLWGLHFLASFLGLAYLPFSKMFHMFVSPISLLTNAVMDRKKSDPANIATRQMMELDACTHCGTCSLHCSVEIVLERISNLNILPSEKLIAVKAMSNGSDPGDQARRSLLEGLYLCTNCYRCTDVCPVGINLQDLWFNVREAMLQKGLPELLTLSPLSFYRGLNRTKIEESLYPKPLDQAFKAIENRCKSLEMIQIINESHLDKSFSKNMKPDDPGKTFFACFNCKTCTAACPVVRNYENPPEALGLVPHQIMHAAILGLTEPIFRSNMLWSCLGCYECQEHCPQGVCITDVLYELKNLAIKHVRGEIS